MVQVKLKLDCAQQVPAQLLQGVPIGWSQGLALVTLGQHPHVFFEHTLKYDVALNLEHKSVLSHW
jgi:hypothetical protein